MKYTSLYTVALLNIITLFGQKTSLEEKRKMYHELLHNCRTECYEREKCKKLSGIELQSFGMSFPSFECEDACVIECSEKIPFYGFCSKLCRNNEVCDHLPLFGDGWKLWERPSADCLLACEKECGFNRLKYYESNKNLEKYYLYDINELLRD